MSATLNDRQFAVLLLIMQIAIVICFQNELLAAHIDKSILAVSSDASVYYEEYATRYGSEDPIRNAQVFIRASTLLLMILFDGKLIYIQIINALIMCAALLRASSSFRTEQGRYLFVAGSVIFPYFILGFLSLNKEIYAMASAMLIVSYMARGRMIDLCLALLLALAARYYMLMALVFLLFAVPRQGSIRYKFALLTLTVISIVAPVAAAYIPQYSSEGLTSDSGTTAVVLSQIVQHYGYFFVYPVKYAILLLTRPYAYLTGSTNDAIGALVSVLSLGMVCVIAWLLVTRRSVNDLTGRLIVAGFVAPIPLMWSEIMHWRYYSFVYFFFLAAIIFQLEAETDKEFAEPSVTS